MAKSVVRAEAECGDFVSDGVIVERSELLSLHSTLYECFVKIGNEFGFLA